MSIKKKGFTLIELLVVIAVIALLLAILMPTLRKAKEAAMRIRCGSRLKQWGLAIQMYGTDNNGKLMDAVTYWGGRPYPHYMYIRSEVGEARWSAEGIGPYINAFGPDFANTGEVTEMITCVNCSGDFMQRFVKAVNVGTFEFIEIAYSYFAGYKRDVLESQFSSNAIDVLVTKDLRSDRLLMAEILNLDTSDPAAYRYNHGKNGWSWNEPVRGGVKPPAGKMALSPNPKATGRSQLFGDGHVEWRNIDAVNNLPTNDDRAVDEWNGPRSGWMSPSSDTSYF